MTTIDPEPTWGPDESDLCAIEEKVGSLTDETRRAGHGYAGMVEDLLSLVTRVRYLRRELELARRVVADQRASLEGLEARHTMLFRILRDISTGHLPEVTP